MKTKDIRNLPVEQEYASLGPGSASASHDGRAVAIDFVNTKETATLRLVFPAESVAGLIAALQHLQGLLEDSSNPLRRTDLAPKH